MFKRDIFLPFLVKWTLIKCRCRRRGWSNQYYPICMWCGGLKSGRITVLNHSSPIGRMLLFVYVSTLLHSLYPSPHRYLRQPSWLTQSGTLYTHRKKLSRYGLFTIYKTRPQNNKQNMLATSFFFREELTLQYNFFVFILPNKRSLNSVGWFI